MRYDRGPPALVCVRPLADWAIKDGRKATRGVDKYLMNGETYLP